MAEVIQRTMKFNKNTPGRETIDVDWLDHSLGVYMSDNLPRMCFTFSVDKNIGRESIQRITVRYTPVDQYVFAEELLIVLNDKMRRAPTVTITVEVVDEEKESPSGFSGNLNSTHDSRLSHSEQVSLECKVCCQTYSDTIYSNIPRILTECGHTICHSCAETIQKLSLDELSIDCPFDRITTRVKVEKLHKNFAIIDLIRERSESEKMATEKGTVGISEDPILPCYENPRHEATIYCQSCAEDYCDSCYRLAHASRINSEHISIPISEKSVEIPRCPIHSILIAQFFCQDKNCEAASPLCCSTCLRKHHKNHDLVSTIEKIDENQIKLTELLESLQLAETNVSGALKKATRCIKSTRKTETDYRKMVSSIHSHFDRKKMEAIQNLESFVDHKREGMEADKKCIEHDLGLIRDTKKEIEKVLKKKDLLFAQEVIDKGEAMCSLDERNDDNLFLLSLPPLETFIDSNPSSTKPPTPPPRAQALPELPPPPPPKSYRAASPLGTSSSN